MIFKKKSWFRKPENKREPDNTPGNSKTPPVREPEKDDPAEIRARFGHGEF